MPNITWQLPDRLLHFERPLVMGIVNVTPDSFSDGGLYANPQAAIAHGLELARQGADILDVGGESTRPGSQSVALDEELRRVVPVVRALAAQAGIPISIDTSKAVVAKEALAAGARIVNDVTALQGDPAMVSVTREAGAAAILMHMQGTPATMQVDPQYEDVVAEVIYFLKRRLEEVEAAGIPSERLAIDPGIGFGKRHAHNLTLLAALARFRSLGRPICLGVSRKGFIGKIIGRTVAESTIGSVAVACHAMSTGSAQILRVHEVAETVEAVKIFDAIGRASP
jgi:dihydropteroate synthase